MKKNLPANWPNDLSYISNMNYKGMELPKKTLVDGVRIVKLDENHLLNGEYGLLATKNLQRYSILGEYTGEVNKKDSKYSAFLLESYGVDANECGNEMRFINDYRNIADKPNVRLERTYIDKKPKVLVIVIEDINEGEEILLDYGESYCNYYIKS